MSLIRTEFQDHIATIALNNYAKRNTLSASLIAELIEALARFKAEKARAVILRNATPEKVWSAGHDVRELPHGGIDPLPYDEPLEQLLRAVKQFPAAVIAMVHGAVWGGACDLVLSCDLVFGDETSAFAITPARLGVPYNTNGFLTFMNRLPLTVAKEMFFTADPIPAERAERVGILNALVPESELEARTYAVAKTIASRSPATIAACKEAFRVLSESHAINPSTHEYLHGLRRKVYFGADYREGLEAFLQKRPPNF